MINVAEYIKKRIPKTKLIRYSSETLSIALDELREIYLAEEKEKEKYRKLFLQVADENCDLMEKYDALTQSQNGIETVHENANKEALETTISRLESENAKLKSEISKLNETIKMGKGGRPKSADQTVFNNLLLQGLKQEEIMKKLGISRATYFRMKSQSKE